MIGLVRYREARCEFVVEKDKACGEQADYLIEMDGQERVALACSRHFDEYCEAIEARLDGKES